MFLYIFTGVITEANRYGIFKISGTAISDLLASVHAELGRYLQQRCDVGDDPGRTRWLVMAENLQISLQITRKETNKIGIKLVLPSFIINELFIKQPNSLFFNLSHFVNNNYNTYIYELQSNQKIHRDNHF